MLANLAPKRARVQPVALALALLALLPAPTTQAGLFSPRGDSPEEKRQVVLKQRDEMLAELYKTKPELKDRIQKAAGYATFKQTDMNLLERYHKQISNAVSPIRAAQFLQVENQMALLIDLNIAAEMPAVGAPVLK